MPLLPAGVGMVGIISYPDGGVRAIVKTSETARVVSDGGHRILTIISHASDVIKEWN